MNLTYYNLKSLNLTGGPTGNTFDVQSNFVSTLLDITAGKGGDTIKVGDATNSLNGIAGTVNVTGSTGTHLILDDEATQNSIVSDFNGTGFNTDFYQNNPTYTITYQSVEHKNNLIDTQESVSHGTTTVIAVVPIPVPPTTVTYTNLASLEVDGANLLLTNENGVNVLLAGNSSSNTVNIQNNRSSPQVSGVPITVKAGDGRDSIKAGDASDSLDNIDSLLVIGKTGTNLVLDDEANQTVKSQLFGEPIHYTEPTFVVTGTMVSRVNPVTEINNQQVTTYTTVLNVQYQNLAGLTIIGGRVTRTPTGDKTGNVFDVQGARAGTTVTINAGAGYDQVNIGSDPVNLPLSTLEPIHDAVTVNGKGVNTTLNINDAGTTLSQDYSVYDTSVHRVDVSTLVDNIAAIGYHNVGTLVLHLGSAKTGSNQGGIRNIADVFSTPAATITNVYGGSGWNSFTVAPQDGGIQDLGIQGTVYLYGGGNPNDNVTYYDFVNGGGQKYTMTDSMTGGEIIDTGFAAVNYDSNIQAAGLFTSSHGGSTVYVLSTSVPTQIQAGTADHVIVGTPVPGGRTLSAINGFLNIFSFDGNPNQVLAGVLLDDSGDMTPHRSVVINNDAVYPGPDVVGLAPAVISWRSLAPTTPVTILGGSGGNTIALRAMPTNPLTLGGGGAHNKLDYSAYTGDVTVELPLGFATGFAKISGIQDVTGGIGNSLLVGDAGANILTGGTLRNILIGGGGGDTLTGSVNQDNILIGGTTLWDTNLPDLMLIMHEWLRTDLNFDQRFSDINSGGVGIANSVLTNTGVALNNTTVFADSSVDTLIEPSTNLTGRYWFFIDADDIVPFSKKGKTGDKFTKV